MPVTFTSAQQIIVCDSVFTAILVEFTHKHTNVDYLMTK